MAFVDMKDVKVPLASGTAGTNCNIKTIKPIHVEDNCFGIVYKIYFQIYSIICSTRELIYVA